MKTMLLFEPKLSLNQVDSPLANALGQELFCAFDSGLFSAAVVASVLLMVLFSSAFVAGCGLVLLSVLNPGDVGTAVVAVLVVAVPGEFAAVFLEPLEVVVVPVAAVDGVCVLMDGVIVFADGALVFADGVLVRVDGVLVLVDGVLVRVAGVRVLSPSGPVPDPFLVVVSLTS